jgi:hypothetical protein
MCLRSQASRPDARRAASWMGMAPSAVIPSSLNKSSTLHVGQDERPRAGPSSAILVQPGKCHLELCHRLSLTACLLGSHRDPAPGPAAAFQARGPPIRLDPLIMSAPSDPDAYSYAKFLVDIYPDDAVEILCKRGSCDIIELVQQQVDRNCIRLGGGSRNKIKGLVEDRRWEELKTLRGSPPQSATTTPRNHRRSGQGPPTPSSTASGSPQSQRNPSDDWIIVYGMEEPVWFMASPSGSEEYLIGEDKLERFQGLTVKWTTPPKKITLGGKIIDVSKHVHFTWNRPGDKGTAYKQFWVVRSELIRHGDVLLGCRRQPSRGGQDKGL